MQRRMNRRRRQAAFFFARWRSGAGAARARRAPAATALRMAGRRRSRRLTARRVLLLSVYLRGGVLEPRLEITHLASFPLRDERLEELLVRGPGRLRRIRLGVRVVEDVQERLELRIEVEIGRGRRRL